jgi:hypothetical protein
MKGVIGEKITGIIYQDERTDEKRLQSGLNIHVKLLTNSKVVGVLYHDDSADESILSDLQLDGLTYWTTSQDDERILEASKIVAILYGDPASLSKRSLFDLRIKGLIYHDETSGEAKLLSGFSHTVHILPWTQVTGLLCREEASLKKKIFESATLSGFLYQDEDREEVNLVSGVRICGVLCERAG